MREYVPDRWAIIEVTVKDRGTTQRVLASWYGGYGGSDSWKISSAIRKTTDNGSYYTFENESGSVYQCNKQIYGASGYTAGVYDNLVKESLLPDSVISLRYLEEEEFRG